MMMQRAALQKVITFGVVGIGASLVHIVVAWAAMHWLFFPALVANAMGFCTAFVCSYLGHYYFTFKPQTGAAQVGHSAPVLKFAAVALAGFAINTGVVLAWQIAFGEGSIWAIILGVGVAAGAVFFASNFWVFARGKP